ncbi:MAG: RNA 2',3'-cyclic phosphodiesterase [Anaerolineae bacterium]|nr:RNA 2',3'-cyclic phosphodiesterase [Anaerolineales bacterium]MCQ3975203.1 RNA 2',3'-cyclic phosphodiesterase [Anaerolineae bacterium]
MNPTLRAFIAIELSTETQTALAELQQRLKMVVPPHSVRWTAPENIHLTLHFLGDVAVDEVNKISDLMQAATSTCSPFALTLGGLGCFPNTRRPRIVWTGVSGQMDILLKLHRELGEGLKTIGFTPEARPYSPHLTVGRVKDDLPQRLLSQLGQVLEQTQPQVGQVATLNVAEIHLMQSDLKPVGPIYTPLAAAALNPTVRQSP